MRRVGRFLVLFALLCVSAAPLRHVAAADVHDGRALRLGIAPFSSVPVLLRMHEPLRDALAQALAREVTVFSAANHERFRSNALSGNYDIVIAPAHFLPVLIDNGYVPLVRYRNPFELLLVTRKSSGIREVEDLRGRIIGLPDYLSFFYFVGKQWLDTLGWRAGRDYTLSEQPSHTSALLAVHSGQIDAALTSLPPWLLLKSNVRSRLVPINTGIPPLPSMTTLVRKDLGAKAVDRIRTALNAFSRSSQGKRFFETTGYGGYVTFEAADVENARRYKGVMRRSSRPDMR
ncbi:MAG: phosphate/phosphite/phosphonate ABC transporter substrate-binding protein [Azoarcus sp.]|jgi:phosphonate transport system substrate-binding protein|nr:phosphate/phosphite/phosphonate ABC transporter substrate-binding protein [Azoarcus sp.]